MHMTLREWGNRGSPGEFIAAQFVCWKQPSLVRPSEMLYHLYITTGKEKHPFTGKYATLSHIFGSFYGLTRYLKKSPDEIEGEVQL